MSAYVSLHVLGLAVVQKAKEGDDYHRVSTVVPEVCSNIPRHSTYFGIMPTAIRSRRGRLPKLNVRLKYSKGRIPKGMRFMQIEHEATVRFSQPSGEWAGGPDGYASATVENLGFGPLRSEVGRGEWVDGEDVRFLLPSNGANADWGVKLGEFRFHGMQEGREVADLFFWMGRYDRACQVDIEAPSGKGVIELEDASEVRILCFDRREFLPVRRQPMAGPFDFSAAYGQLCDGGEWHKPESLSILHPGSGSCPPVGYP